MSINISVIIPIYNAETFLEETIVSVLNQTYDNIELILVNHASTDSSQSIIEKYAKKDNRIIMLNLDVNKGGPAYPRNEGIKVARGNYIAFVDSDDVWIKNKLEFQLKVIIEKNIDIVHTGAFLIDSKSTVIGKVKNQKIRNIFKYFLEDKHIILLDNFININSVLMKVDKNHLFKYDKNYSAVEDWDYWIDSLLQNKKSYYMPQLLMKYRIHDNAFSQRSTDKRHIKNIFLLSKKALENQNIPRFIIFLGVQKVFLVLFIDFLRKSIKNKFYNKTV